MDLDLTRPSRNTVTRLGDGRALHASEWGRPSGRPVLFCTGAATSASLGFGAAAVERLGVRLIAVDRPGLGGSSPSPRRTLLDWADDIRHLAAAQRLEHPCAVGFSQGAPFALACAAAGVASRVAIVSGTDELAHPTLRGLLDPSIAEIVDLAALDPAGAEAFFRGMTPSMMWQMVINSSAEPDRAVLTSAPLEAAYRSALDEAFAQGPGGYARDALLAFTPWPFEVGAIAAPVELWYGELDTSPSHSPDRGATLERRLAHGHRHVVPDAGSTILWTHAEEILTSLVT